MADPELKSFHVDFGNGAGVTLEFGDQRASSRQCGSCSLCCKLMPSPPLKKAANEKCRYSRHHADGCCKIYDNKPTACSVWSCRWLVDPSCNVPRPDRAHYVIDVLPDKILAVTNDGQKHERPVIQIWLDPDHADAHRDPRLRAWLAGQAEQTGAAALVRVAGTGKQIVLAASCLSGGEGWVELPSSSSPSFQGLYE